ncbi:TetR/AcrR family transcriptional regulator [Levilactobacillus tujiorum]|uniref:TetR/AcrR family transcriptional regulator n=1 Tax=Levilactobacillus tujiorum TaxID=2912243 RepID=A0ABX1L511_9LACO|nr:TetR/AcrR family transcriptional regulator [Levilactobacillus tujiorum]MCH5464384.1 TetR/AcrR family transcriptional regulator [Levilactobacillus tujiorum]NLR11403.1 TetR/AcrR family transcriptional regulator [Lactobacillus sp. HBUAS51387]NLR29363.1 TetR/AcrR family transcriptional regulator [Levilactobacillus tujiorum]
MEEKQTRLFTAAHDLFLAQGFKHTSIAEIAEQAGVAVGTFYNFYQSKFDIFIQVYNAENEHAKGSILATVDLDAAPADLVKTIIQQIFAQSAHNQILQEWFSNPQLNALIAKTNQNAVEDSLVYATLMQLIDRWQARGLLKSGISKQRIISLFNALTVVDLHQSEIQTDDYYQLLNDLIAGILAFILK